MSMLWKKVMLPVLMIFCFSSVAHSEEGDFRVIVGTLDNFSKDRIVVSDRALAVSRLVSCYDRSGQIFVGCSGINKARWVEVSISWETNEVINIRRISESDYLKALGDD